MSRPHEQYYQQLELELLYLEAFDPIVREAARRLDDLPVMLDRLDRASSYRQRVTIARLERKYEQRNRWRNIETIQDISTYQENST